MSKKLEPNSTITDQPFLRRTYLAIIGRIPTTAESAAFVRSHSSNKHSALIESNVRAVEVSYTGWDTHANNFTSMPLLCSTTDHAVGALLDDLECVGKLQDTVVVLTMEFGRTPIVNKNSGRDHDPKAFTSVLAGGGFKAGYVYGKTSAGPKEVAEDPVTIPDFNATIAPRWEFQSNVSSSPRQGDHLRLPTKVSLSWNSSPDQ